MSKPAVILVPAAFALALAVLFVVFVHPEKRPPRSARDTQESTAAPSPPAEAPRRPLAVLPATSPTAPGLQRQEPAEGERLDEASLVARLRDLAASDPTLSLKLAREAVARFPNSANAAEFEWNVVKALANMERYNEAEQEALVMLRRYPDNPFTDDVEHHVLNHPPNPANVPGQ